MGLAEFVLVATLVEITPGPNMAYLASLAAVHGRRAGIQAVLGILLGLAAYGILAAFGLAALVGASPTLYAALRFAGVAYMLWLAVEAWRDGDAAPDALQRPVDGGHAGRRGFLVSVLNPKAGVFYLTVLPEFVDPARGAPLIQNLTLVAIYVAIATAAHLTVIAVAGAVHDRAAHDAGKRRMMQRCFAMALTGVAAWLLFATPK
ncbi:MAG: LysE family translocator [Beijerinckiaceae bacterium]